MAEQELAGPECPEELAYVWAWFLELHATRGFNGMVPNPITFAEIGAWSSLTRTFPLPSEVDLLRRLDMVWMTVPKPEDGIPGDS